MSPRTTAISGFSLGARVFFAVACAGSYSAFGQTSIPAPPRPPAPKSSTIDEEIRARIQGRTNASEIRDTARRRGTKLLGDDGLEKIADRRTTADEIIRISMRTLQ